MSLTSTSPFLAAVIILPQHLYCANTLNESSCSFLDDFVYWMMLYLIYIINPLQRFFKEKFGSSHTAT